MATGLEASPKRPKRSASQLDANITPSGRAKRARHGPNPSYVEIPEEETNDDFAPTKRQRKVRTEIRDSTARIVTAVEEQIVETSPGGKTSKKAKTIQRKVVQKQAEEDEEESLADSPAIASPKKKKSKDTSTAKANGENPAVAKGTKNSTGHKHSGDPDNEVADDAEPKPKRRRKTKEEKDAEAMPIAPRTVNPSVFIGAHVSAAGGVHNSVTNSLHIGGNAFALFQKSQRKWDNPSIKQEHAEQFKSLCASHGYAATSHVVPHGSYLVNLAQRDTAKATQAYDSFLEDLHRSESLGIKLYNFHPGNTNGEPRSEAIGRIAERLNAAHKATKSVVTLLENMAASPSGNTIGGRFEDLREIIDLINDKTRVGVCLDTCHTFAAGYDLRTPAAFGQTMSAFDTVVGFKYLRAVHMNDSKAPLGAHRDLHQNIGCGFLGLRAFHNLVNDVRFAGLPLILETPIDRKDDQGKVVEDKHVWAREIKLLESLVGMDADGDEFKMLEKELADKGAAERMKYQEQYEKKLGKESKKGASKTKGQRKGRESSPEDSDEDE